ncbi:MAG: response regulator [Anaerolineae bacterium]|nr:response regulator [Anaerolineae bacterium]
MATILVIDDDKDYLYTMHLVLEGEGYTVETATTPEAGIAKVLDIKPDLVVLDVVLKGGLEGFEVARALREDYSLTDLPILMLTAIHSTKEVPYRFAPHEDYLPVDVFMDKPIEPELLVKTVQEMLGERREEPEYPL